MGYKILADNTATALMNSKYGHRPGLEGPFMFTGGRVLYYDPHEGSYYDPTTDFFVEQDEMDLIHQQLMDYLKSDR